MSLDQTAAVLVDLRERQEVLRDGLLPGAFDIPRGLLEFAADPASPLYHPALRPERRVILDTVPPAVAPPSGRRRCRRWVPPPGTSRG